MIILLQLLLIQLIHADRISFDIQKVKDKTGSFMSAETADIKNRDNKMYYVKGFMGSNGQELEFLADTGSALNWVYEKSGC